MPVAIFFVPQVVNLVWPEATGPGPRYRMNYPVNRTDFTLLRSVQNEIEFFLRDIDRKAVDLDDVTSVEIVITDQQSNRLLLRRALTVTDEPRALMRLAIAPGETDDWPIGFLRWSVILTRDSDSAEIMLWTDRDYQPFGFLRLMAGPLPAPTPETNIDPDDLTPSDGYLVSSALSGAARLGQADGVQTFVFDLDGFIGDIIIEGSLEDQPTSDDDWFEIEWQEIVGNTTEVMTRTITANAIYLRLRIRTLLGSVNAITYRV